MYTEEARQRDYKYFVKNNDVWYNAYGEKYLAIKDETLLGVFDSITELLNAMNPTHPIGSYIIQQCTSGKEQIDVVRSVIGW